MLRKGFTENRIVTGLVFVTYIAVVFISRDNCFFWDNIQQTSKEAHWFYYSYFNYTSISDYPGASELISPGYHPPLIGIVTALLWRIFGANLIVSHIFVGFWALILLYNTYKLVSEFLPENFTGIAMALLLSDSTLLTQISIASPDIILLTCFVTSIRAILFQKNTLLAFSLLPMMLINGRGVIAGAILFVASIVFSIASQSGTVKGRLLLKQLLPFMPAFILTFSYYLYYFIDSEFTFIDSQSPWSRGWEGPDGLSGIVHNLGAFALRLAENGRLFIWATGVSVLLYSLKTGRKEIFKDKSNLLIITVFVLLFLVFLIFAVTTKLVIHSRYYMGMFFIFSLLLLKLAQQYFSIMQVRLFSYIALLLLITGNLWIYPDRIAKAWDGTLAHIPFYSLRSNCLNYISDNSIDFANVSAGFCLKGNQRHIDLKDRDLFVSDDPDNRYFIYSNISNLDDQFIDDLSDPQKWSVVKTFSQGFVRIVLYENLRFYERNN